MKIVHLFCLFFLLSVFQHIYAVTEVSENQVRRIAHKLRCPTCQGLSVKESEAGLAENMKAKVRSMLSEGKSEAEILEVFVARYGEWILRSPEKKGFNLVLWITPGAIIILAALTIVIRARASSREGIDTNQEKPLTEKELKEIDREIQKLERS